jgi:P27 family predicted phage terminase small subunit
MLSGRDRRKFKELARALDEMGVLSLIDQNTLTRYVALWGMWVDVIKDIRTNGRSETIVSVTGSTYTKLRPEVGYSLSLAAELRQLECQLGLTPSARTRLKAQKDPEREKDERKRDYVSIA